MSYVQALELRKRKSRLRSRLGVAVRRFGCGQFFPPFYQALRGTANRSAGEGSFFPLASHWLLGKISLLTAYRYRYHQRPRLATGDGWAACAALGIMMPGETPPAANTAAIAAEAATACANCGALQQVELLIFSPFARCAGEVCFFFAGLGSPVLRRPY